MMKKGALQAVTPQEEILAPYLALANEMKAGRLAQSDVDAWVKFFRTVLFTFKVLPTHLDKEFETIAIRQQAAARYFTISYTPVQWVCKIIQMKRDREAVSGDRLSSADIAKMFKNRNFKPAKGQEDITETFIDNALYIGNRALCFGEAHSLFGVLCLAHLLHMYFKTCRVD